MTKRRKTELSDIHCTIEEWQSLAAGVKLVRLIIILIQQFIDRRCIYELFQFKESTIVVKANPLLYMC